MVKYYRALRRLVTGSGPGFDNLLTGLYGYAARIRNDPTLLPPPGYSILRARQVYGEAFRRAIEYSVLSEMGGNFAEFGTFRGFTARTMAQVLRKYYPQAQIDIDLFDSFAGFPAIDSPIDQGCYEVKDLGSWYQGALRLPDGIDTRIQATLTKLLGPGRARIHKGYYADILVPDVLPKPLSLLHIDCDLYASTKTVLYRLAEYRLLLDGCVLMFDDYNCGRANPSFGERRAFADFLAEHPAYSSSPFFSYGWNGMAFFLHKNQ